MIRSLPKSLLRRVANVTDPYEQILLVPTTEVLITHKDRETGFLLTDLVYSDDFIGSHVLRTAGSGGVESTKEVGSVRDNRGRAKQFTTANGRTVVVKESYVYSVKGVLSSYSP